jgi:hypothetical protein
VATKSKKPRSTTAKNLDAIYDALYDDLDRLWNASAISATEYDRLYGKLNAGMNKLSEVLSELHG